MSTSGIRRRQPIVQSLARADALLSAIASAGPGGATLADACKTVGLHRATAHHLLQSLRSLGYIEQERTSKRYFVGLRNLEVLCRSHRLQEAAAAFREALASISHHSGEAVNLAVPYVGSALIVESVEGNRPVRTTRYVGSLSPYHASACGKAILCHLDDAQREQILQSRLEALTPRTIIDRGRLERAVAEIRTRGYALDLEENELGASCIAVAVLNKNGTLFGSVSIAGLSANFTEDRTQALYGLIRSELAGRVVVPSEAQHGCL